MARKSRVQGRYVQEATTDIFYLAGIYGRLSVEDGDDTEQNSIGNQRKIGLSYLEEHTEIQLVDTYADYGYTGMNYNRPDFKRMLRDLQSGRINCIIIKDVSRLGRHFVLTSEFVERTFPEMGVRLISINDNYDSLDKNADAASLTLPLKMVMNDYYVKDISRKIRSSITAKMLDGEFLPSSGSVPYGYLRDPEHNTFAVDSETAVIVQRIFEMRASGMKFNAIAKQLNMDEIPCPGKLRFLRGMTKDKRFEAAGWIRGTIRKITNDPVYLGKRIHGKVKRDKIGMDKTRRKPEEWQVVEQAHPAIISQELYETVQRVNRDELELRSGYEKRADAGVDYRELFNGKVICGDCKSMMVPGKGCARPDAKTPSRIFYDCNGYRYSNHTSCSSHYIRQETLMAAVTDSLNQQVKLCVDVEKLVQEIQAMPAVVSGQSSVSSSYAAIHAKRGNLEAKIERLLVDLTERFIEKDEYLYMKKRYTEELEELLEQEAEALKRAKELNVMVSTVNQWISAIKKYQELPVIDRKLLDILVDHIEVFEDRHIKIVLNYADPYQPITEYLEKSGVMQSAG